MRIDPLAKARAQGKVVEVAFISGDSEAGGGDVNPCDSRGRCLDGGLIVGYRTAALLRAGGRVANRAVDSLLNRLSIWCEQDGTRSP